VFYKERESFGILVERIRRRIVREGSLVTVIEILGGRLH